MSLRTLPDETTAAKSQRTMDKVEESSYVRLV